MLFRAREVHKEKETNSTPGVCSQENQRPPTRAFPVYGSEFSLFWTGLPSLSHRATESFFSLVPGAVSRL